MYNRILVLFILIIATSSLIQCKSKASVPNYIQRCKKNDPHLDQCLLRALEASRSKFDKGIPELGIPSLDPLILPQVVLFNGEHGGIKAIANNISITGVKNIKILKLKVNLDKLEFETTILLPRIQFEGFYDVNAKFSEFRVKGTGPFKGNASHIMTEATLKAKLINHKGIRYLEFESMRVHVTLKSYEVKVEKLFKDPQLNDAFNKLLNDQNVVQLETMQPLLDKLVSKMWIDTWNKLSRNISFDELFLS